MFIDVHGHAYRKGTPSQDGSQIFANPSQVLKRYDELGIEMGFLLPLIGPEIYLPQSNEDVMDMCKKSGGRLLPFCNIDPRGLGNCPGAQFNIWLDHYKKAGCYGVGEVMPNIPFMDPRSQNLFKHIEAAGLPFTFDISSRIGGTYGFYDDPGLPQLEQTLKNFPKLIILGHGPAFWVEMARLADPLDRFKNAREPVRKEGAVPKLFRRYKNLYGDLSAGSGYNALARDPEYAAKFINEFQDRLLYGTDICSADMKIPLPEFLISLKTKKKISNTVFKKIARENAIKLFNL